MKIHIVTMEGIHISEIYGVYEDYATALEAVKWARCDEDDDYHSFEIKERTLNQSGYNSCNSCTIFSGTH